MANELRMFSGVTGNVSVPIWPGVSRVCSCRPFLVTFLKVGALTGIFSSAEASLTFRFSRHEYFSLIFEYEMMVNLIKR